MSLSVMIRDPRQFIVSEETRGRIADEVAALEAEIESLHDRTAELNMLAYGWMDAHDKLKAGKKYSFPAPVDLPNALAEIEHATADAAVMRELAKRYRSALQRIEEALTFKIAIGPSGALSIAQQALQTKDCEHTERVWDANPEHDEKCLQCGVSLPNPTKSAESLQKDGGIVSADETIPPQCPHGNTLANCNVRHADAMD